ncbi:uncharacterized protein [Henckelia pumila]|uniref:uncharacterized protein n=1 Tax=Henckelia pumila TaxID=405737 RepID=UPI003C6E16C8
METHLTNVGDSMKNLEIQIDQIVNVLTNQQRGAFPSNTEVNPIEQFKAITLRSGKEVSVDDPKVVDDDEVEEIEIEFEKSDRKIPSKYVVVSEKLPVPKSVMRYPQRFKKKALDDQFSNFLDIFKKIRINIQFADALEKMPHYEKFMKDVMSRKRKLEEFEMVKLTEEALELGEVKPTTITLQLADHSLTYPRGIVENVLVKVDKFIFPADFVVHDMEEYQDVPLILGRPFLETGRALIDVQEGELTLRVGGEAVTLNIYKTINYQYEICACNRIDLFDSSVNNFGVGIELNSGRDPKVAK